jgi:quercetin dioxygenase-like cupin family protein
VSDQAPIVVSLGDGERFDRGNRVVAILAETPQFSVLEIEFDATFEVPPHSHDDYVDSFFVLDGEVEFTVGDRTLQAGPGTLVVAPQHVRHGFRTHGPGRARVLNFHTPDAGFAESVRRG